MFTFAPFKPCPPLAQYIERYLVVSIACARYTQTLVPSNNQNIGFVLKGSLQSNPLHQQGLQTGSYVLGQTTQPVNTTYFDSPEVVAIVFRPAGMHRLFGIPMTAFTDRALNLEDIGAAKERELKLRLLEASSNNEKVAILECWLLERLAKVKETYDDKIAYVSNRILKENGSISLKGLMNEVNMSERSFQRHFADEVGVPPKTFSCIARTKAAMEMMLSFPGIRWKEIAYRLNYSDQAHFIHEFKKMSGRTPGEYFRSTTEFEQFLYGC